MAALIPYLNFYGRCTEAMNLYKEIFGGDLSLQLAGDSPAKDQMPEHLHNQVLHSHLVSSVIEIMATDMAPTAPVEGNTVYLALICSGEEELKSLFEKLFNEYKRNTKMVAIKEEIGEMQYTLFKQLQWIHAISGIKQSRLPYTIEVE